MGVRSTKDNSQSARRALTARVMAMGMATTALGDSAIVAQPTVKMHYPARQSRSVVRHAQATGIDLAHATHIGGDISGGITIAWMAHKAAQVHVAVVDTYIDAVCRTTQRAIQGHLHVPLHGLVVVAIPVAIVV